MTTQEVAELCRLMAKHGLTVLRCGDVVLERPPRAPKRDEPEEEEDELRALARQSPDAIDAALARARMQGGA